MILRELKDYRVRVKYSPVAGFSKGCAAPVLARQSCASSRTYFLLKMWAYVINYDRKMMKRLLLFDGFIIGLIEKVIMPVVAWLCANFFQ